MKSTENFGKKNVKRSGYTDLDDKLKPVKSTDGKSGKRISIYESTDDEFDEDELDEVFNYKDLDPDDDFFDDELDEEDDDYDEDDEEDFDDDEEE